MYEAIKEITGDLIKKRYIKNDKDLNLHIESKLDQYCFKLENKSQRESLKKHIIENALKEREEIDKAKLEKQDIKTKKSRREGKSFIAVDFCKEGEIHSYKTLTEGCKKMKLDPSRVGEFLRNNNEYYLPRKRKWIINKDNEENEMIIEHLEEIVQNAKELYEIENKCGYTYKLTIREAIQMAIKLKQEEIKNEYKFLGGEK